MNSDLYRIVVVAIERLFAIKYSLVVMKVLFFCC